MRLCARGPLHGRAKASSPLPWQGPSPLPQGYAGIRTGRGPRPAASARPALGGRFPPAGSDAGLWFSRTLRSAGNRRARAVETRVAFPGPARTDDSTVTAPLAGAIAPATALRRDQDRPGANAPGQRPPRPRRALCTRRVGRWPFVVPGPTGLQGTVAHGRGKRGSRFLIPPALTTATLIASLAGAIAPATARRWP